VRHWCSVRLSFRSRRSDGPLDRPRATPPSGAKIELGGARQQAGGLDYRRIRLQSRGQRWWGDLRVPPLMEQRIARILLNGAGPAATGVRWSFRTIRVSTTLFLFAARLAIRTGPEAPNQPGPPRINSNSGAPHARLGRPSGEARDLLSEQDPTHSPSQERR